MKRGAHLLKPGPAGAKGRFVREIMLLLDGISVGGQIATEGEVHPCNVCDESFSSLQIPSQLKFDSTVVLCLHASFVAKSSTPTTASTNTICLAVASLTTKRFFTTSPCGARTTVEEIIFNLNVFGGGGEEEEGSLQL